MSDNNFKKNLSNLVYNTRKKIIDVIKKNGGHFSSNLGVCEIFIAIHKAFNLDEDLLIIDIGHQCYTHKILTSRKYDFSTIRKPGGLSGFLSCDESKYDLFETGHSGLALPYAIATAIKNKNKKIICFLGDGSFAQSFTLASFNLLKNINNLIIIINNNFKNISPSYGLIHDIIDNKMKAKKYFKLFNLNFKYNKDGNNVFKNYEDLVKLKKINKSSIYLINTIKGYKYNDAENDITGSFHAITPLKKISDKKYYPKEYGDLLLGLVSKDKDNTYIVQSGMTQGFFMQDIKNILKENYIDTEMNEEISASIALALAKDKNNTVILPFYSSFLQRSYDQIINDINRQNIPILFLINRNGLIDQDGATHQGLYTNHIFNPCDNIDEIYPLNKTDFINAYNYFKKNKNKSLAIIYSKYEYSDFVDEYNFDLFKFNYIKKTNNKKVILSYGSILFENFDKIKKLDINIINTTSNKIYDFDALDYLLKNNYQLYVYEESILDGSLYLNILNYINEKKYNTNIKNLYIIKKISPHNSRDNLISENCLDIDNLIKMINC